MKISSCIALTVFITLGFVDQKLQAMTTNRSEDQTKQLSLQNYNTRDNRRLCKRILQPAKLDEFRDYGTVFHGKKIQDVVPDTVALKILKPENTKLIYGFDIDAIRANLILEGISDYDISRIIPNIDGSVILIYFKKGGGRAYESVDLVGEQQIAAKIMLLSLIARGEASCVATQEHLKKLFATLSPDAQRCLDEAYNFIQKPEQCDICYGGKYADEVRILNNNNEESDEDSDNDEDSERLCPFCRSTNFDHVPELVNTPISSPRKAFRTSFPYCTIQ